MKDEHYMKLALQMAEATRGQTTPNPMVGSVVVKNGEIIGMGAHLKAGEGHAEAQALKMAGDRAKDATIYVTLEPCSHHGRTPPCADLIIERGLKRVVIASVDSNPAVAGRGIAKLRNAGIEVEIGVHEHEAQELNKVFFHFIKKNIPYVTLKSATTLDGKTATSSGKSKWITGSAAREDVHRYRHTHDAILVGVGTVIEDNPTLTTRLPHGGKNPIRIVLDRQLRTPLNSKLLTDGEAPTWIVTKENPPQEQLDKFVSLDITVIRVESYSIKSILKELGSRGITSLFVEGGAEVNGSFLEERAINQVITYLAPKLFGGKHAPTVIGGTGVNEVNEALRLEIKEVCKLGEDVKIVSVMEE